MDRREIVTKSNHNGCEASHIEAVILDYGEVLSLPPVPAQIASMAEIANLEPDVFHALYRTSRGPYDRGDVAAADYWLNFAEVARVRLGSRQIEKLRSLDVEMWSTVNPQMTGWLECLLQAGLKTGLLSNMIGDMAVHVRQESHWLNKFTCQVLSCEVGLIKPDAAIYEHCLARLQVKPSEALFVDDQEINVQSARALGITSIRFQSAEQLHQELAALGFPVLLPGSDRNASDLSIHSHK
jgi:putative hydrolase of the HAD superfamily